jgi:hypothetical protein
MHAAIPKGVGRRQTAKKLSTSFGLQDHVPATTQGDKHTERRKVRKIAVS